MKQIKKTNSLTDNTFNLLSTKTVLSLMLIFISISLWGQTGWIKQTTTTQEHLYGIDRGKTGYNMSGFGTTYYHYYAVGANGTVLYLDEGLWVEKASGTSYDLNDISIYNWSVNSGVPITTDYYTRGFIAGENGRIIRIEGGTTLGIVTSGTTTSLYGVSTPSKTVAYFVGDAGVVYKTVNADADPVTSVTVSLVATITGTPDLKDVHFTSSTTGWVCGTGGKIFKTTNSGSTWTAQTSNTTATLNCIRFIDANYGWASGNGVVLRTTNGGTTWTEGASTSANMYSHFFLDANTGFYAGNYWSTFSGYYDVTYKTTDGGVTLSSHTNDVTIDYLYDIYMSSSLSGYIVGEYGTILYTSTGGRITPTVVTQPESQTICFGDNASFSIAKTGGNPTPTVQWQENTGSSWANITDGGIYSGATSTTLLITAPPLASSGYQYRCVIDNGVSVTSAIANLSVYSRPAVTTHPTNKTICEGSSTTFVVSGSGTNKAHQWQYYNGSTWVNINDDGVYSGTTNPTLTVSNTPLSMNGKQFRCVISGYCDPVAPSNSATLTVYSVPSVTVSTTGATQFCNGDSVLVVAKSNSTSDDFESGDLSNPAWSTTGNALWSVTSSTAQSGMYSAMSGALTNYQTSDLQLSTSTLSNGLVSFDRKINSPNNNGSLRFYIDGVLTETLSGTQDWTNYTTSLTDGAHTLDWKYSSTYQIGSGTTYNGTTSYPTPFGNYYQSARQQFLYPASLLIASGMKAGTINSFSFQIAFSNLVAHTGYTVQMKNTTTSNLSTAWITGLTTVKNSSTVTPVVGWNTITLDNPFVWDGTSNIVMEICFSNGTASANSRAYYTATGAGSSRYYYATTSTCATTAVSGTSTYLPNMRFGMNGAVGTAYIDNLVVSESSNYAHVWKRNNVTLAGYTNDSIYAKVTGAYTAVETNNGLCATTSEATQVDVYTKPTAIITAYGATTFCDGGSVIMAVGTGLGYSYQWYKNAGLISGATASTYEATTSGSYTVKVTSDMGCITTSAPTVVTVNSLPIATNTSGTTTVCEGTSIVLTGNTGAGYTYQWQKNAVNISGATVSNYTATSSGSYRLVTTNASSCSNTATAIAITVNPLPGATITTIGDTTFCSGGSAQLLVSSGAGYIYQWKKGGTNISGATVSSYIATTAGVYTVVVTDANSCTRTSSGKTITVNPLPTVDAGTDIGVTNGSATNLTGTITGGTTPYVKTWTPSAFIASGSSALIATTTQLTASRVYTFTGQDAKGCSMSDNTTVTVSGGALSLSASASTSSICKGASVVLSALASGGTGSYGYTWSSNPAGFSNSTASPTVTPTVTTTYTISVNDGYYSQTASTVITVNPIPTASLTAASATTFCDGNSVQLDANIGAGYTYIWKKNGSTLSSASSSSYSATETGTYTVEISNSGGCTVASTGIAVTVNPLPLATNSAATTTTFCQGNSVVLNGNTGAGLSYQWQKNNANISGATLVNYTATQTGNYRVVTTNSNSCSNTATAIGVTVNSLPGANITVVGDTTFCEGNSVQLLVGTGSSYAYQWKKNGSSISGATLSSYISTTSGNYTVVVTDGNNCINTSNAKAVTVNSIPVAQAGSDIGITNGSATSLTGSISGGTGPYTQAWTPSAFIASGASSLIATTNHLTSSTVYTFSVQDSKGCNTSDNTTITVSGGPLDVNATASASTVCSGTSVQLNGIATGGTGAYVYTWSSTPAGYSNATANPIVTPTVTTTYKIKVDDGYYLDSATIVITVNAIPAATLTPASALTFCAGNSVQLDANTGGGLTYIWKKDGNTISSASSSSYSATQTGIYTVEVTNAGGCSAASAPRSVSVNALPFATVTPATTTTFCQGGSVVLSANAGAGLNYQWQKNNANISGSTLINYTASTTGNYRVVITDANSCSNTATAVTVTSNTNPSAVISTIGDTTFCEGNSVQLLVGTGTGYVYQWKKNGSSISGATLSSYSTTTAGAYSVAVTDGNNCSNTSSNKTVTVNSIPAVSAGSDIGITNGSAASLTGSVSGGTAPYTQSWIPSAFIASGANALIATTKQLTSSTVYTFTAQDAKGCGTSDNATVTVSGGPLDVNVAASSTAVCGGSSIQLNALPSGGTGVYTYSWTSTPAGYTNATANPTVTPTVTTTYNIKVNDGYYLDSAQITITVSPIPTAAITPASSLTFCAGNTVQLDANTGSGYTYVWKKDGSTISSANSSSYIASQTGTYQVEITNAGGCSALSTGVNVTVNALPFASAIPATTTTFCQGGSVVINGNTGAGLNYQWQKNGSNILGATTVNYTASQTGNYRVVVSDVNSCANTAAVVSVAVNSLPVASITTIGDTTFCQGNSVQLLVGTGTSYIYQWKKDGAAISGATLSSLTASQSGNYTVVVIDGNNCSNTSTGKTVTVNALPLANAGLDKGVTNGSATTLVGTVSGGTGPYTQSWTPSAFIESGATALNATTKRLTSSTVYTFTVQDAKGCSTSDNATVLVSGGPLDVSATASSAATCGGSAIQLSALASGGTGSYTYAWSSIPTGLSSTSASPLVSPTVTSTYQVIVQDGYYTDSVQVVVSVNNTPTASLTPASALTFCQGGSVKLDANTGAGYTYQWKKDNTFISGESAASLTATLAGDYQVVITNAGGCSAISTPIAVVVNAIPNASISTSGLTTFCQGDSVVLSSNTGVGYAYQWKNNGNPIIGATTNTYAVKSQGVYSILITDLGGCSKASSSTSVTVNALPDAIITTIGDSVFCQGGTATLTVGTGTGYGYQWKNNSVPIANATDASLVVNQSGNYSVLVTNTNSCARTSVNKSIVVNPLPLANISTTGSTSFCGGDSVILTASSNINYTYQWRLNGGDISSATNSYYAAKTSGNYTLHVNNQYACSKTSSLVTVNSFAKPDAVIASIGDTTFCKGGSAVLTVDAGTGSVYQWKKNTSDISGATISTYIASQSGSYTVFVRDANNCTNLSAPLIITAKELPIANAGLDKTIANGTTTVLTGSATNGSGNYTYTWKPAGLINTGANTTTATTKNLTSSTVFDLTVSDDAGCSDADWVTITVSGGPLSVTASSNPTKICDVANASVLAIPSGGSGVYTYSWTSNPAGFTDTTANPTVTPTVTTTYTVVVTDGYYTQTATTIMEVDLIPIANVTIDGPAAVCQGSGVTLNATTGAGYTYIWKHNGNEISGVNTSSYSATQTGDISVMITNSGGCSSTSTTKHVTIYPSPVATIAVSGATTFCAGDSAILTATSGYGNKYQWKKNNIVLLNDTTEILSVKTAGIYTVDVTSLNSCTKTSNAITINVNSQPDAEITLIGDSTFCQGGTSTLTVGTGTGYSYQWKNNNTAISGAIDASLAVTQSGTFSVVVTNPTGCSRASSEKTIVVNPLPFASITTAGTSSFCGGDSVVLSGAFNASNTYQWRKNGADINLATTQHYTAKTSGNYTLYVTNEFSCSKLSSLVSVNAYAKPDAIISSIGDTVFCQGGSAVLTVNAATGSVYQWKKNGTDISDATISTYIATQSGNYTVFVRDANNCTNSSAPISILAKELPIANAGLDKTIANGTTTSLIGSASGGAGKYTYAWKPAGLIKTGANTSTASTKNLTTSTVFNLVVTDTANCSDDDWATISVTGGPLAVTASATPTKICTASNSSVMAIATGGSGIYTYTWSSNPAGYTDTTANPTVTPTVTTTYTVLVNDGYYTQSASAIMEVDSIPTAVLSIAGSASVCQGNSVSLNASTGTGYTYIWKLNGNEINGANSSSYNATQTGDVSVVITNNGGCSATSSSKYVSIYPAPTATISAIGSTTFCEGGSATLVASSGYNDKYQWKKNGIASINDTLSSLTVTTAGIYTVDVTSINGCSKTSNAIVITVNTTPDAIITAIGDTTFCQGGNVTLTVGTGTGYGYQWTKNGIDILNASDPSLLISQSGTYGVVVNSTNGCSNTSANKTVTVNSLPIASINTTDNTSFCSGDSARLLSAYNVNNSYQWKKNGSDIATANSANYTAKTSGNYTVLVTNEFGCKKTSVALSITTNQKPDAVISTIGDTVFCSGGSTILSVNAVTGSVYQWMNNATDIANANMSTYSATQSGNYSVVISDIHNCSNTSTPVVISVKELPLANAGADMTIANGTTAQLTGSASLGAGKFSYVWKPAGLIKVGALTNLATTKNLTSSAVFSLTVTDTANCSDDDAVTVIVKGGPLSVVASASEQQLCSGATSTLQALATGGSGVYSYVWTSTPTGFTSDSANPVVNPSVTTTYSVVVNDGYYTQTASITIAVDTITTATISVSGTPITCQGGTVALTATKGTGLTYQWERDNQLIGGASSSSYNAKQSGDYAVIITNTNACSSKSAKQKVTVNPLPEADITADVTDVCQGQTTLLTATYNSAFSYKWKKNNVIIASEIDSALTVNTSGNYSVVITDANNCSANSTPVSISVHALPTAIITAIGSTEFCAGKSVQLNTNTANGYLYQWKKNNVDITDAIASTLTVSDSGAYAVLITDALNCSAVSTPISTKINANPDVTVSTSASTTICNGDVLTISVPADANAYYSWKWNGIDLNNELTNAIDITKAGQYSVIVSNSLTGCTSQSTKTNVTVNALPAPAIVANGILELCIDDTVKLSTAKAYSAYNWSSGATTTTAAVTTAGTYSVTVTDANGCSNTDDVAVTENTQAAPEICMVSVSPLSGYKYNIIVFDSAQGINIDRFIMYKLDDVANMFKYIGEVKANTKGIFTDSTSTPNKKAEFYKISMVDNCENETAKSNVHKTMLLTTSTGLSGEVNLTWDNYQGLNFSSYTIWRGPDIDHLDSIDHVSNLTFLYKDVDAPKTRPLIYNISINLPEVCRKEDKTKANEKGPYAHSRSNVEDAGVFDNGEGIGEVDLSSSVTLYPNPTSNELIINSEELIVNKKYTISITNVLGEEIKYYSLLTINSSLHLDVSQFSPGTYFLKLTTDNGVAVKKFVKE